MHGANQLTGTISIKADSPEKEVDSFAKSKWKMFDREFAARLKEEHPDIWAAGGNIKGNAQYAILTKIAEQGGKATTPDQVAALELREAWVARHAQNSRLPGVIAQIKWLAVGSRGEDYMKNVVREAIDKKNQKSSQKDEKGHWMNQERLGGGKPGAMMMMLINALEARAGSKVKILDLSKNTVIFAVMKGDEVMTLRAPFYFDGMQFMFGEPEPVKKITSWVEIEDGDEEEGEDDDKRFVLQQKLSMEDFVEGEEEEDSTETMKRCACGCKGRCGTNPASFFDELVGAMKSDMSDIDFKAGRVISAGNLEKLRQAIGLLEEIVAAGGRAEIEMKDDDTVFVGASTERLFALKSFIDPVIDFHGAECHVTDSGISFKSSSNDFVDALNVAVSNFNRFSSDDARLSVKSF